MESSYMKALVVERGDNSTPVLALRATSIPVPGENDLLVRVAMAGVNRSDLAASDDHNEANPDAIAGSEFAGVVIAVGKRCVNFALGDRVMALAGACNAEFARVDHRVAARVPDAMDWRTAASLPAWFMTAYNAVVTVGQLRRGESVLIQGATTGVGMAAAQLARMFGARTVMGVARSAQKFELLRDEGFDELLLTTTDWVNRVNSLTAGRGTELVIDMVGGGVLGGNLRSAALRGRIVAVGRLGGKTDQLDLDTLAFKRLQIIGVTFRSRSMPEKSEIVRAFCEVVIPAVLDGRLRTRISRIFPLEQAELAYEHARSNFDLGKTLLEVGA